jgi:hypothetical protein
MSINVIQGPIALSEEKNGRIYWRGWASGNIPSPRLRLTPEKALKDAEKLEKNQQ